ncbi:MAG: hypothetical protein HW389_842 [Bacteroidetes bacterium]|nr:hypothetical protein [Bacteroidota bacterium]
MRSYPIISFFAILFVFFIAGCAETPTTVGAKLLPNDDLLRLDTTVVSATRSYNGTVLPATSISPRVLVGNVDNIQCWGIYRFSLLPDSIKSIPIVSAELDLRTIYHFGDSLAPFSMTVHQILMNWATDSLTIDSLKAPGFYRTSPSGAWNSSSIGDTSTLTIPLDTTMIRSWGTVNDTTLNNFGVLLRPTNNGVVKGFGSFMVSNPALGPKLLLRLRNSAGKIDTLSLTIGGHRFVTTGLNPAWASDSTHLWVQNGGANRGYVEFDVSAIPLHAAVHKATLELTLDSPRSKFNYFTADSAYVYFTSDDGATLPYIVGVGTPVQVGTSKVYQFPVGAFVQRWVRGAVLKRMAIAGFDENFALDLFSFYGAQSTKAVKPKLTIIYSVLQ